MRLPKYSISGGDRFAHQAGAQLAAIIRAYDEGVVIAPVWNKSHREHTIVGSCPVDARWDGDALCSINNFIQSSCWRDSVLQCCSE